MTLKLRDPSTRKWVTFPVLVEEQSCDGTVTRSKTEMRSVLYVAFRTQGKVPFAKAAQGRQVITVPSAQARSAYAGFVGLFFNPHTDSGSAVTEITWQLQYVPAKSAPTPTTSTGPIRLEAPFFSHSQYETNVYVPLLRAGERVRELDRKARCSGRIVGGPAMDEVGSPWLLGEDFFAGFDTVTTREVRFLPGLARYKGKPVAVVGCRFYYESSYAASRKTLKGSISVVAGGRRASRSFSFTICDWQMAKPACRKKWSGRG